MPTVKDELGNVVAEMPYDDKGEAAAEKMVQDNPNLDIDYAPGGTTNAPDNRESYQLGLLSGQPGFGQKPMANPLSSSGRLPGPAVNPLPSPGRMPGTAGYVYKEGGKTNKYKKK